MYCLYFVVWVVLKTYNIFSHTTFTHQLSKYFTPKTQTRCGISTNYLYFLQFVNILGFILLSSSFFSSQDFSLLDARSLPVITITKFAFSAEKFSPTFIKSDIIILMWVQYQHHLSKTLKHLVITSRRYHNRIKDSIFVRETNLR